MGRKNHRGVLLSVVMSVGGAWGDQGVEIGELSTPEKGKPWRESFANICLGVLVNARLKQSCDA